MYEKKRALMNVQCLIKIEYNGLSLPKSTRTNGKRVEKYQETTTQMNKLQKRCTDDLIFVTKTVGVGDDVTLSCTRQTSWLSAQLFWIRLVSGNLPEFLGGTFTFDYDGVNKTPRITSKQEPGSFVLHINNTKLSDTGVYYCIKVDELKMTFLKGTFLSIKGPEPDITAVIHVPPSDPVRPGDSVTLQCSVLSRSENKTCPGDHSVSWFRAGSDGSHPSVMFAHANSGDECEKSPDARSPQTCVYSFSKNVSSSDAGNYYCAVAACGEILFGHGTKQDIEGNREAEHVHKNHSF
ncbi:signal-regulatory protein beta-2-like [Enoplosus armatus]|uniref:signal-regulatory protein beta-2-like n=1 Tax=Enoplosus armatus TaxID=215367 RepID=UPI003991FB00